MRIVAATAIALAALTVGARAADSDYCTTYAQERVTSLRMTDPRYAEISNQLADYVVLRLWAMCLNADVWPPENDKPKAAPTARANEKTCRAHFKSYDPKDGTVIPFHQKRRVPCPL